ncbi:MAG: hypothetical protein BEN18_06730 [Epulopiscium sp. Nuni2H_MBin001]|nr:MAG: hypothetical protein BEN18_06730 [Epulopiscium sp. Nuni2H_MBin001]
MSKRARMIINIAMTIILILLMDIRLTGMLMHEVLGTILIVLFGIHFVINIKWMKSIGSNFKKVKGKNKLGFILNVALLIGVILMACSSLLMMLDSANYFLWRNMHVITASLMMLLIVAHIVLHWNLINNMLRNNQRASWIIKGILAIMALLGLKGLFQHPIVIVEETESTFVIEEKEATQISVPLVEELTELESISISEQLAPELTADELTELEPISISEQLAHELTTDELTELEPISISEQLAPELTADELEETEIEILTGDIPTLNEYLASRTCGGCMFKCNLNSYRCSRGEKYAQEAIEEYNAIYRASMTAKSNYSAC